MVTIAVLADVVPTITAVILAPLSIPVLALFVVGVRRSGKLLQSRSCLGTMVAVVSFVLYLAGLFLAGALVVQLFQANTTTVYNTSNTAFGLGLLLFSGYALEGVGYGLQALVQRRTKANLPEYKI